MPLERKSKSTHLSTLESRVYPTCIWRDRKSQQPHCCKTANHNLPRTPPTYKIVHFQIHVDQYRKNGQRYHPQEIQLCDFLLGHRMNIVSNQRENIFQLKNSVIVPEHKGTMFRIVLYNLRDTSQYKPTDTDIHNDIPPLGYQSKNWQHQQEAQVQP